VTNFQRNASKGQGFTKKRGSIVVGTKSKTCGKTVKAKIMAGGNVKSVSHSPVIRRNWGKNLLQEQTKVKKLPPGGRAKQALSKTSAEKKEKKDFFQATITGEGGGARLLQHTQAKGLIVKGKETTSLGKPRGGERSTNHKLR